MSAISDLTKNKKALVILAIALIVIASGLFAYQAASSNKNKSNGLTEQQKKVLRDTDKKKEQNVKAVLGVIVNIYRSQNKELPPASESGWNEILSSVPITDSFTDPYSRTIYRYAAEAPDYGQIQYGPGKTCKKDGTLTNGYGSESLALRARFTDGYRCYNNFQG